MSKHFFERLEQGYAGIKKTVSTTCNLNWCDCSVSKFKGVGSRLCETHQSLMREYGGPGRTDRPWTFNKKRTCDCCGHNPWEHPKVQKIKDPLVKDRVAWGMLIVDHINTQRDGGTDHPDNCQTLCLDCNQIKSTLACDTMPKKLYKDPAEFEKIKQFLFTHYIDVFQDNNINKTQIGK
jgi:hypothetical protein